MPNRNDETVTLPKALVDQINKEHKLLFGALAQIIDMTPEYSNVNKVAATAIAACIE